MAWYNASWTYRKPLVIAHTDDGAQTDYQVKLLIGQSSGATGEQFDLASHCQADFDDLIFTTSDGETLCPYWIESITGASPNKLATVWVKVSVAAHPDDTTIYCYYGNAGASATSSGADTFITFDDFERGVDSDTVGGDWTEETAHVHISTAADIGDVTGFTGTRSMLLCAGATSTATIPRVVGTNYAVRWRWYKENTAVAYMQHGNGTERISIRWYSDEILQTYNGAYSGIATPSHSAWHLLEVNDINHATPKFDVWLDGAKVADDADTWENNTADDVVRFTITSTASAYIDDFIIRNWTAGEPAFSSAGSEESTGWSNISKVNGIVSASISKVNGIAVASISKVNGIAV